MKKSQKHYERIVNIKEELSIMEKIDLGKVSFLKAWELQLELVEKRAKGEVADTLIVCEHEPVYTFGRNYKESVSPSLPFPAYKIERGGKATYHGPGQLILYPICKLKPKAILPFIRFLEGTIVDLLLNFGLNAECREGETGVWIGRKKIASIGIAVKHWVTFHGAAINVDPDLSHFFPIEPCGYAPHVMTSISLETGKKVALKEAKDIILARNLLPDAETPKG